MNLALALEIGMERAREIFAAGWIEGYMAEDMSYRSVNPRIDLDFAKWLVAAPEPPLLLYWRTDRPAFDYWNPMQSMFSGE